MKESSCTKSQNGCVVKDAYDDYHGTYDDYEAALKRQQNSSGNRSDVTNEVFLYKVLLEQAARETQQKSCGNCPFVISDP
jgi:hypothetical protein